MTSERPTIALLQDHFLGDYQTALRDAVEMTVRERDIDCLCVVGRALDSPHDYERVQNQVFGEITDTAVDGVVIISSNLSLYTGKAPIEDFCKGYRPLPVCSIGLRIPGIPSVLPDNRLISLAVEHLAEVHGCRRFAYIGGPSVNEEAVIRRTAVRACLEKLGLPLAPELDESGVFTLASGCEAASRMLASKVPFDALVVANDTMALGAISILKKHGIKVPEDVKVTGFDDIPAGRFNAPRLTTMRQRLEELGRYAVDLVLKQIRGETAPIFLEVAPRLVPRQTCGCTQGLVNIEGLITLGDLGLVDALRTHRQALEALLVRNVQIPEKAFSGWASQLIEALEAVANGAHDRFSAVLSNILEIAANRQWVIDELQTAIAVLRAQLLSFERSGGADLGSVWNDAHMLLMDASAQGHMKNQIAADLSSALFLRRAAADMPSSITEEELVHAIAGELEAIGIENGLVSMFTKGSTTQLECIVALRDGEPLPNRRITYDVKTVVPDFLKQDRRMSYVVIPLSSHSQRLGVMVLESAAADLYYEILREHMSSYLKAALG